MNSRPAIAQYEATVVLVVISLSLASVVYDGLRRESTVDPQPLFTNTLTLLGGAPAIERLELNASSGTTLTSLALDGASSADGILAFNGTEYSATTSLCLAGETTFFSVLAPQAGTIQVATDGEAWVAGMLSPQAPVSQGWQEVMIEGGTTCALTLPGGEAVQGPWSPSSQAISSVPSAGPLTGTAFTFYFPSGGGSHGLLITSSGGFDDVAT
jgi:hypothetical protein